MAHIAVDLMLKYIILHLEGYSLDEEEISPGTKDALSKRAAITSVKKNNSSGKSSGSFSKESRALMGPKMDEERQMKMQAVKYLMHAKAQLEGDLQKMSDLMPP